MPMGKKKDIFLSMSFTMIKLIDNDVCVWY
jgi:hypothetical protein